MRTLAGYSRGEVGPVWKGKHDGSPTPTTDACKDKVVGGEKENEKQVQRVPAQQCRINVATNNSTLSWI